MQNSHCLQGTEGIDMDLMTLTAKGQCTFRKQLLEHMGVKPGEKLVVQKLSDGSLKIQAKAREIPLSELQGCIETLISASDDEITEAIAKGYINSGTSGLER
jgi:antitoxin component of MazEF toxin-antitoxin module